MNKEKLIDQLNLLITRNFDASKGYRNAALRVSDLPLRKWLKNSARDRKQYITNLSREVRLLNGTPDQGTSLKGDLHRTWLDFKAEIFDGDITILQECITGENTLLSNYKMVLEHNDLPDTLEVLLSNQVQEIKRSLDGLKHMGAAKGSYS